MSGSKNIILLLCTVSICVLALSACGSQNKVEKNEEQQQQSAVSTTVAPPKLPAAGEKYLEQTDIEARMKAAKEAERYIKEETKNHLDRLVLNPESEYWNFPEDLSKFDMPGQIITYDAYVDGNSVSPYRIVLIRGSEKAKWEVKRFSKGNENLVNKTSADTSTTSNN